jgi:uncharacterized protein YggT (Ycf19 family)
VVVYYILIATLTIFLLLLLLCVWFMQEGRNIGNLLNKQGQSVAANMILVLFFFVFISTTTTTESPYVQIIYDLTLIISNQVELRGLFSLNRSFSRLNSRAGKDKCDEFESPY